MSESFLPRRIGVSTVLSCVAGGWAAFRRSMGPALAFAGLFVALGVAIFATLAHFGLHAMMLPFAGGFLLVGPAVLAGFIGLRRAQAAGRRPVLGDVVQGFRRAPRGLWVLAGVCCLLLLIWLTDAATVYSFMIGAATPGVDQIARFHFWTSLMGAVLAFIVFNVTAFSVPLLLDGRALLVGAVTASVRAIFANFGPMLVWGLILAVSIIATVCFPPLLLVSLPCLAFATDLLYLEVYPPA